MSVHEFQLFKINPKKQDCCVNAITYVEKLFVLVPKFTVQSFEEFFVMSLSNI